MYNFLTTYTKLIRTSRTLTTWIANSLGLLIVLLLPITFCSPTSQAAQIEGAVDPTFKSGSGPNAPALTTALQSDGKIIVVGDFTTYDDKRVNRIARLNPDGSLDPTFNSGLGAELVIFAVQLQSDGKILIGGQFTTFDGVARNRIARLNSNGSLDTSFNVGTGANYDGLPANTAVATILIQSDDKILIGGDFTTYNGVTSNGTARLNSDGSLDTAFSLNMSNSGFKGTSHALQNDGKIIAQGSFSNPDGTRRSALVRLNNDGTLDTSFNSTLVQGSSIYTLALQNDGKILIGGRISSPGIPLTGFVIRLNSDGSTDTSFSSLNELGFILAVTLQNDGKVLVGGYTKSNNGISSYHSVIRLNTDGMLDSSFNVGIGADSSVDGILLQSGGRILISGHFTNYNGVGRNRLARLNPDGSLDTSFLNSFTGTNYDDPGYPPDPNTAVATMQLQNDGRIVIGGRFFTYNGASRSKIARLNSDGTLDTAFNPGLGGNNDVLAIALENNGKIIIGGKFTTYDGITRTHIARLNSDGTLDTAFNPGLGANGEVMAIALQSDGKIILAGSFSSYNEVTANRVARLNTDGSLDNSFSSAINPNGAANTIALQNDGKIVIGGAFSNTNPTYRYITRLNTDGSLDSTFNSNSNSSFNASLTALKIQNDGKIVAGGLFNKGVVRLNSDGSPDSTFNPGAGANNQVKAIALQSDGKIMVSGWFTAYNGSAINQVARLNTNGSLDNTFNPGTGPLNNARHYNPPAGSVFSIAIQTDNKIIIGGWFMSVDSYTRDNLARLEATTKTSAQVTLGATPNPADFGQTVTFTATVSPTTATGTVGFNFGSGNNSTSVTIPLVNGVATYVTNTLPVGATPVWATYSGDANFALSLSQIYTQTINKIASSVSLTSTPNPATFGQTITFTTTVSSTIAGAVPPVSGVVTFSFGLPDGSSLPTTSINLVNGVATYVTNTLATGSYTVTASYSGDANYTPGNSQNYNQVIQCNPLLVTNPTDNGQATTCGTLSYALTQAGSEATISFLPGLSTFSFSNVLTPTLPAGVTLDGGLEGVILDGKGVAGDGLQLTGNNSLLNLTIRGFGGREIVLLSGAQANKFYRVKIES